MPVTTRTTATQSSVVRLKINIKQNGVLTTPYSIGDGVTISNPSAAEQISGVTPTKESTGIYYIDYSILATAPVGTWEDSWKNIVYVSGLTPADVDLNFYVQLSDWAGVTSDICRIYEFLYEPDGTPLANEDGTMKILDLPYAYGDAYYSAKGGETAYSDASGKIQ